VNNMGGPLDGLRVVDLTTTLTGAHISQTLADFGCEVIQVEPPGGSPLREQPAWPFWGRGKHSIELDLDDADDLAVARRLATSADVVVETWRPGVAERFGLGYEELKAANPRVVYASVTGFGRDNPWSHLKGYEQVVLAKIGGLDAFSGLSDRPGPSYVAAPYCTFTASQLALHGILAALVERESSGLGQRVDTTLVQGILAHDTWNWLILQIVSKYGDAFTAAPPVEQDRLVPHSGLFFRLMVAQSKDGRFMQLSQTTDRLWEAFLRITELDKLLEQPEWKDAPGSDDPDQRIAFWERALAAVKAKTYDEWLVEFDREPDVWAEVFRYGTELLHHPQMEWDHRTVVIDDPAVGAVHQPGPIVTMETTPALLGTAAPALDEHGDELRGAPASTSATPDAANDDAAPTQPPLAGITVIELGTFYAAPFGTTLLADLGARVIKVEQLDGDPIRHIMPFPEIGGIKVLQGKESVAVDMATAEGREVVLELVRRADVVLQSFRAGVAERHGYTGPEMLAVNPDLVYLNAPGYGVDGPCGHRPAFAPTIGAGSGLAYRNIGGIENLPQVPDLPLEEVKRAGMRLAGATMTLGQADGFSAAGVATALLLGILAKQRGGPGQVMTTSMLSTMAHCLSEDMVEYAGRAPLRTPDRELFGLDARYRLYETQDGWVFLAAPAEDDWVALASVMELDDSLRDDDTALAARLAERFATRPAAEWETTLTALDVACVEVAKGPVERVVMSAGGMGETLGIVTPATHPMVGDYPRLTPTVHLSRSEGRAGLAPLCGEQTDAVLTELGYDESRIAALREAGVIL
jgi:crotonobetainyl-CoA:carnitine CoA-transferase CaiB-like acyl-CoA transferase